MCPFVVCFFLAVMILVLLYYKRKYYSISIFSLFFLIFLLPVINPKFVPSYPTIDIRFAYISSVFMGAFFIETYFLLKNVNLKKIYVYLMVVFFLVCTSESLIFQSYMKDDKTHLEKLIMHYPDDSLLLITYSLELSNEGKYKKAFALVDRALKSKKYNRWTDPSRKGGLLKANIMIAMGNLEEGKAEVEKILKNLEKKDLKYFAYLILSKYYEKRKEFRTAIEMLKMAQKCGETSDLFFRMAVIYAQSGKYKIALGYLEKAKTLNPDLKKYQEFKKMLMEFL